MPSSQPTRRSGASSIACIIALCALVACDSPNVDLVTFPCTTDRECGEAPWRCRPRTEGERDASPPPTGVCSACPDGTFSRSPSTTSCISWRICQPGTVLVQGGSPTSDRICNVCTPGTYSTEPNAAWCRTPSCPVGTYAEIASDQASVSCEPCAAIPRCAPGGLRCNNALHATCTTCEPGYMPSASQDSCDPSQ